MDAIAIFGYASHSTSQLVFVEAAIDSVLALLSEAADYTSIFNDPRTIGAVEKEAGERDLKMTSPAWCALDVALLPPLFDGDRRTLHQVDELFRPVKDDMPECPDRAINVVDVDIADVAIEQQRKCEPATAGIWLGIVATGQLVQSQNVGDRLQQTRLAAGIAQWGTGGEHYFLFAVIASMVFTSSGTRVSKSFASCSPSN